MRSSARNELKGTVCNLLVGDVMAKIQVEILPSVIITASSTSQGLRNIGALLNDKVYTLIKASSIILSRKKINCTASNNIEVKVEKITIGDISSEVKLSFEKNTLYAVLTNDAINELKLKEKEMVYAIFKSSSVILVI